MLWGWVNIVGNLCFHQNLISFMVKLSPTSWNSLRTLKIIKFCFDWFVHHKIFWLIPTEFCDRFILHKILWLVYSPRCNVRDSFHSSNFTTKILRWIYTDVGSQQFSVSFFFATTPKFIFYLLLIIYLSPNHAKHNLSFSYLLFRCHSYNLLRITFDDFWSYFFLKFERNVLKVGKSFSSPLYTLVCYETEAKAIFILMWIFSILEVVKKVFSIT